MEVVLSPAVDGGRRATLRGRLVAAAGRVDLVGSLAGGPGRYVLSGTTELQIGRSGRARLVAKLQRWTLGRVRAAIGRRVRLLGG